MNPIIQVLCAFIIVHPLAEATVRTDSSYDDQLRFWTHDKHGDEQFQAVSYAGLNTFARIPFENCFNEDSTSNRYDIAILGAPHDTTVTGRPGARYGPSGIRSASQRKVYGYDVYSGRDPLHDWATVVDCGDARMTWLDNRAALKTLGQAHRAVSKRPAADSSRSEMPRIIALGGDHTTTLPALRSTHERWGPVSVIHFDSHIDTWDPAVLGGGISNYAGLNHGTFLHIAHEEHLILNSSIHVGIRAPLIRRKGDIRNDKQCGFEIISTKDIDGPGRQSIIEQIRDRVGDTKVYVSVDIDVLDPAFAPATGTPEPGGWSTRELLAILEGLEGLQIIGGDVVEVAPIFDTAAETTALAAAEIVHSLIDLMVTTPVNG
ncbi:putative agmatinase 1 [Paramyrothecium foliicola]|nr:putative agmatinase 1 [Paramyrothecium foliicola]